MAFSFRAVASTGLTNIAIVALTVFNGALQARLLGPEGRGQLMSAMVYPTLVVGIGVGLTEPTLVRAASRRGDALGNVKGLIAVATGLMGVVLPLATTGVLWGLDRFGLRTASQYEYIYALAWGPLAVMGRHFVTIEWGQEQWTAYNLLRALMYPCMTAGLVGLWWYEVRHVTGVLWVHVGTHVVLAVVVLHRFFRPPRPHLEALEIAPFFREGRSYLLAGLTATLLLLADQLAATMWLQDAERGNYAVALRVAGMISIASASVGTVAFVDGSTEKLKRDEAFYLRHRVLVLVLFVGVLGLLPVSWVGIPLVFGEEFAPAREATFMLLPGALLQALSLILEKRVEGEGRPRLATTARLLAILVLGLTLAIISRSLTGLALAFSIAQGVRYFWLLLTELRSTDASLSLLLLPRRSDLALVWARVRNARMAKRG
ncbi:MAG: hypothetical protein R3B72_18245 [Polyangiaceae bacterium]